MWRRRAAATTRRMLNHGHRLDLRHLSETVRLIMLVERGAPETTSRENWNRSHHLPACPCHPRQAPFNAVWIDTMSMGTVA
jgi:hypothetical protein